MANNVDKRSVATDALETLGTIIPANSGRDAIHLAVEPCVAATDLFPGNHIGFLEDGTVSRDAKKLVGIVDPFLNDKVKKGERFWLVVYPRTITSLRHVWTHPDFEEETPVDPKWIEAEAWLRQYAESYDETVEDLINAAHTYLDHNEYYYGQEEDGYHGKFEGESVPDLFWEYFEIYTGRYVNNEDRGSFFSCSC